MKERLKSIISNGLPFGLVFFTLNLILGILFHVSPKSNLGISSSIGFAAILATGLIYKRFSKPLKKLESISINLNHQEFVLTQAPANHLINESLVPGKLFLTNERLIFKAFETFENDGIEYAWDIHQLRPVDFYKSMFNSGREFLLRTTRDESLMFEVNNVTLWKNAFKEP